MHELSITKSLIRDIKQACESNQISAAKSINVELGMLTTYKKEPLIHYFNALKPNSPVISNAELIVKEIPGKIYCKNCQKESAVNDTTQIFCKKCESFDVIIIDGMDIRLKSITENEE